MKKAAAHSTTKHGNSNASLAAGDIAMQFLDTTWRIAVPVVLFALVGIVADRSFGTKPWFTLLGVVIGFGVAGLLIKRLLDQVLNEDARL